MTVIWLTIWFLSLLVVVLSGFSLHYYKLTLLDDLTKLKNYRYLKQFLSRKINSYQLVLVLIDIDNFGLFNKISINTGDKVLSEFADLMKCLSGNKVLITRYRYGDEFALVFENITTSEAKSKIDNFQKFLASKSLINLSEMPDYRMKFSYGIADNTSNGSLSDIFKSAEISLAKAKNSSR